MYIHRSGYHPPHELLAAHCRRRYRLTPLANVNPSTASCDPSLWIVHYSRSDVNNQYPVNRIPITPQVQQMMSQRKYLQQSGQLVRKEFMLNDRNNWPTVNLPANQMPQYGQQQMPGYPGNVISHLSRSQQQSYMQEHQTSGGHQSVGPPSAKRPRQTPPTQRPGPSTSIAAAAIAQDPTVEDEEDTSRGDLMDFLTPRDISTMRYTQHHEWMEEIFSSPYATGQIMPVDLGLGRKGELKALTQGFFEAPTSGTPRSSGNDQQPKSGALEVGKAEDFTKRAAQKLADISADMVKLRKQHARRMAKLSKGGIVRDADRRLRQLVINPSEITPDPSAVGAQMDNPANGDAIVAALRQQGKIDEIGREVEAALNLHIEAVQDIKCVQKGGLEKKAPPEVPTMTAVDEGKQQSLLESGPLSAREQHAQPVVGSVPYPAPSEIPNLDMESGSGRQNTDSFYTPLPTIQSDADIIMAEPSTAKPPTIQLGDSNDWVIVDKQAENAATEPDLLVDLVPFESDITAGEPSNLDPSDAVLPDFDTEVATGVGDAFDATDFGEGVDFGGLDTAGAELAGYGGGDDDGLGGEEGVDLGLEDSAFGDAFHHTEAEAEAQVQGQGQTEQGDGGV